MPSSFNVHGLLACILALQYVQTELHCFDWHVLLASKCTLQSQFDVIKLCLYYFKI